jgi:hypothetical protein
MPDHGPATTFRVEMHEPCMCISYCV